MMANSTSGLRRSTRETPSIKQLSSSPSSTRKSERLEKQIITPPLKKKPEKVEKQRLESPLRRSDRGKKQPCSSSSGSKKSQKGSGTSYIKRKKLRREKSMKKLAFEGEEDIGVRKRRDARAYKASFSVQKIRDPLNDKLSQVDSSNREDSGSKQVEGGVDECERISEGNLEISNSSLKKFDGEMLGDVCEVQVSSSSQKNSYKDLHECSGEGGLNNSKCGGIVNQTFEDDQMLMVDSHAENKTTEQFPDHTSKETSHDGDNDLGSSEKVVLSKRKRNTMDIESNVSATIPATEICIVVDDAVSSPSCGSDGHNNLGTCITCSKRRRLDNDAPNQELCSCNATSIKDSCHTFSPEDRGELDASVNTRLADNCDGNLQQKEISLKMDNEQNECIDGNLGGKLLSNDNISKLKRRLSRNVSYDGKSDSPRFVEYWVPVWISNVQLELYCNTLLSNSYSLSSTSRTDNVGALQDILTSTRKCCDHPYIVEPSLQALITEGLPAVEYLDVGVKASGKLQLLDMMLSEIKNRQLRVVIIFQSIGCSGSKLGDILDDYLRQRFGPDSYERVDGGLISSKKQAALNKFNEKDSGRFVFLIEKRACLPSIKLSSVDTVIIFDTEWNPANDLRSLHKMSLEPHSDHIKVFRLYSSGTVEEKVLILSKCDLTPDGNLQGISRSTSHTLLMWGASYLYRRLEEFHGGNVTASSTNISYDQSLLEDVVKEFIAIISQSSEDTGASYCKISKVQHNGGSYSKNNILLSEPIFQLPDGEPHVFWTKLLEGRKPRWNYPCGPSQRNRKRVQYFDHSPHKPDDETEAGKKRKKVVNDIVGPASLVRGPGEGELAVEKGGASAIPGGDASHSFSGPTTSLPHMLSPNHASTSRFANSNIHSLQVNMDGIENIAIENAQKSLHLSLKPEISKLSEVLQLSEDVKHMVGRFLEYVIHNHHVSSESATILQAFQISLCCTAASILKQKINRKESLVLAKQHLNFDCKEEEVDNVYLKLRELKKNFVCRAYNVKESNPSKYTKQAQELYQKQQKEIDKVHQIWESVNIKLNKEKKLHAAIIRSLHSHMPLRTDKLKKLDDEFSNKIEENTRERDRSLEDLAVKHLAERNKESQKSAKCLEEVEPGVHDHLVIELPLPGSEIREVECSQVSELSIPPEDVVFGPEHLQGEILSDRILHNNIQTDEVPPCIISETATCEARGAVVPIENANNNEVNAIVEERGALAGFEQTNEVNSFGYGGNNVVENQPAEDEMPDESPSSTRDQEVSLETTGNAATNEVEAADLMPPAVASGQGDQSLQNQVQMDECVRSAVSLQMQDGDVLLAASGEQFPQRVQVPALHSDDVTIVDPIEQQQHPPTSSTSSPISNGHSNVLPVQAVDRQTSSVPEAPLSMMEGSAADHSNQHVISSATQDRLPPYLPPIGFSGGSHLLLYTAPPQPPTCADPLQNEVERLRKEAEHLDKVHEETKLQLRINMDNEIKEIHRRYEAKLQDAESQYSLRKKDLDLNQTKVLMNKRLADAFKLMSSSSGMQNPQQQPWQQQPTTPRPVISSSTIVVASSSQQQQQHTSNTTSVPPPQPSCVQYSSAPPAAPPPSFPSGVPAIRPLQISSITLPSSGNVPVREIRAPAPHLQAFRPPPHMPTTSPPVLVPFQPSAPPHYHHPHQSGPFVRPVVRPEIIAGGGGGGSPAFVQNQPSSTPMVEMFTDIGNSTSNINLPPLPELNFNFDSWDPSEFGAIGGGGGGASVAVNSTRHQPDDVVCLSDDD